jgi:NAD(P)-dependent dehydrogenase (short-subunit alcohol dehydrogenase family)
MKDSAEQAVRFDGRVAVVSGAGNGLGREYAKALAARGAAVVVNDLGTDPNGRILGTQSEGSAAERVVREIRDSGGQAVVSHETCATREGGAAIIDTAIATFGRLDILIHNAGFLRNAPFEEMTDEQIRAVLDVHLLAGFYLGQPAYRQMKTQRYGRIILTSSASGMFGSMWQANYSAAKAGLVGLMNNISQEGKKHGIQATAVLPNAFGRLGRGKDEWPSDFFADAPSEMDLIIPSLCNELVVPMVVWLASERCNTTQAAYTATAGRFARVFVGEVDGWLSSPGQVPTPEDIEKHFPQIEDRTRYCVPKTVFEEFNSIIAARKAASQK